jgi:hypothetical protein
MSDPNKKKLSLKDFLSPITLITSLILILGLFVGGIAVLFLGRNQGIESQATPVINIIPAPTLTPKRITPTVSNNPTPTSIFILPEGVIGVGAYIQVVGTEGAGLRMRAEPGLAGEIKFTALDSEVFLVIDGPVEADGYTWWHLEAPYDQTRNGWSAGEFLTLIEEQD